MTLPAPKRYFLQTAIPFFVLYCFFVAGTPQAMLFVHSPFWEVARIMVFIFWSVVTFFHLKPSLEWNQKSFIVGIIFGGGWMAVLFALWFLLSARSAPVIAYVATGLFYGVLSGLWSCQSPTFWRAALSSFFFFLLQLLVDLLIHMPFSYVT
jgi:hypothetical protein